MNPLSVRAVFGVLLTLAVVVVAFAAMHRGGPHQESGFADAAKAGPSPADAPESPELKDVPEILPAPEAPKGTVMVEVQGAVGAPGYFTFPEGARLHDALRKAGGPTEQADTSDLNIAARLIDGSVVTVPYRTTREKPALPASALNPPQYTRSGWSGAERVVPAAGPQAGTGGPAPVNLNTATQSELEQLPGVGPKTAEKILRFRALQPFRSIDDLRHIPGLGDKRVETLRPLVTVE